MIGFAALFLVLALVAAGIGFTGFAGELGTAAWVVFFVFASLFVVATVTNALAGRRTPSP